MRTLVLRLREIGVADRDNNVARGVAAHTREFEHSSIANGQNGAQEIDGRVKRHDNIAYPVGKRQKRIEELVLAAVLSGEVLGQPDKAGCQ
jgi:hypothetical protein